jgi:hypothetical protein
MSQTGGSRHVPRNESVVGLILTIEPSCLVNNTASIDILYGLVSSKHTVSRVAVSVRVPQYDQEYG